jgi:HK97 family phage major capsid protein
MPPVVPPTYDYSGVIPREMAAQIIQEAAQYSTVLQLANLVPMGTQINELPIPKTLPRASFVNAPGGRKPFTELALEAQTLRAEEVAAVSAIPDQYLEDAVVNIWGFVRPRLAEAIGLALDDAVIFGTGAPPSYPTGGIVSPTFSQVVAAGSDAVDAINQGMSLVEAEGLGVTGHAADLTAKGRLRGVRDDTGALLLGVTQADQATRPTIYGLPASYSSWPQTSTATDLITGAWNYLMIGVRQDIRYTMDPNAVIADAAGQVIVSGFQDNVTPIKVWARFAAAIVRPVTPRRPGGARPFARMNLGTIAPLGPDSEVVTTKRGQAKD